MSSGPALVVGLGNPGREYDGTRHNLGFEVVDLLARQNGATFKGPKGVAALATDYLDRGRKVILAKPQTYMNLSGEAVRELVRYYKIELDDVVVVHDDLDLPLGTIRVKRGGGDGGHNGLKHITKALGTPEYARVRLGIGRPQGRQSVSDYVLQRFAKREQDEADVMVAKAAEACEQIVHDGLEAAQARYHAGPAKPAKSSKAITKERVVRAPLADVWRAWTTVEGARTFFAPDARIELRKGGPYEILFRPEAPPGEQGSEGCKLMAFEPERFLVFSWNAPPHMPEVRKLRTRVEVRFSAEQDATKVTLMHTGWREGGQWDEAFAYFEEAWDVVLDRLAQRFESGPLDWDRRG